MLQGRDAVGFAQAQFMNDLDALATGQWQWNGWLTPKGRVIALFALLKLDEESVWLLLPDADPRALAERLRGFLFRSKVTISVRDDLEVSGRFSAAKTASGNLAEIADDGSVEFDMSAEGGPRGLRIAAATSATDAASANTDGAARWRLIDLEHGLPRLPESQAEQWTPQQLSLQRLSGFSIKKGCYPGQEIVARTHFLGKAKRGLVLLEATAATASGSDVTSTAADGVTTVLGRIAAAATHGGRHVSLAVLPLERGSEAARLSVDGTTAREGILMDGLAR
ncbi:CAF17-like 4Fe-4S cluster assembly/insertion protein YgfZ [Lysobacter sp. A289]